MNSLTGMLALLLGLPLVGSIAVFLIPGHRTKLTSVAAGASSFFVLLQGVLVAWSSAKGSQAKLAWTWFTIGDRTVSLSFEFNNLTIPLLLIVVSISFLVTIYSIGFLKNDDPKPRYFATLALFTFSMIALTLSGNLLQFFIFWELVGLSSYLLIGYYRSKPEASAAATKSFIMNKIGDAGFLIALMMLWSLGTGLEISDLASASIPIESKTLICLCLTIAVCSKSAQFPFHTWLPDAMEGPTPVSALIHSATMVAAGVFLLARLHFLYTPTTLLLVSVVGAVTALIGGLNALSENGLKRILAWSTISQLGLMVMVAGNVGFNASFVHLLSHAVFKAGLFLSIGVILMNKVSNSEEVRKSMPKILTGPILFLCLALMGIPFTTGFLSKETMLGALASPVFIGLFFIVNLLTIFYTVRLMTLMQVFSWPLQKSNGVGSFKSIMVIPIIVLASGCLWIYFSFSPISSSWANQKWNLTEAPTLLTIASIFWILAGAFAAFSITHKGKINATRGWVPEVNFDRLLQAFFVKPILILSDASERFDRRILDRGLRFVVYSNLSIALLTSWFDKTILDGGVNATARSAKFTGNILRQFISGKIQHYIVWTLLALIAIFMLSKF
jgi:NADH-quinone oxidoreductase subunit L